MTEDTTNVQSPDSNHIDYKDVPRMQANLNPHARMQSRKRTGLSAKAQRDFARAVKRARFMALLPYIQY